MNPALICCLVLLGIMIMLAVGVLVVEISDDEKGGE